MSDTSWRHRVADRLTFGELTAARTEHADALAVIAAQRAALDADPDRRARTVLGSLLARPEVAAVLAAPVLAEYRGRYGDVVGAETTTTRQETRT